MKPFKHYTRWYYYPKSQRLGFVTLLLLLFALQVLLYDVNNKTSPSPFYDDKEYLAIKTQVDSAAIYRSKKKDTIYPFNPNFISDFKGQQLEMTVDQIDRLHAFRKNNKYVNSHKEFQELTKVSDVWMDKYKRYFKFPDWVIERNKRGASNYSNYKEQYEKQEKVVLPIMDINVATAEDLQLIRGIGPAYSERIIRDRDKWKGYVLIEQVKFLNIPDEVVIELCKYFVVKEVPIIVQVSVNKASIDQLKVLPYMNYYIAREIVKYRSMQGDIVNKDDLREIEKFPLDKIDIISLYLDFKN